jgi:class 3 adenylate cyclase
MVMSFCAFTGLAVLGIIVVLVGAASTLSNNQVSNYLTTSSAAVSLLETLQEEMGFVSRIIVYPNLTDVSQLSQINNKTDSALVIFQATYSMNNQNDRISSVIATMDTQLNSLNSVRNQINSFISDQTALSVLNSYSAITESVINYIGTFGSSDGSTSSTVQAEALTYLSTLSLTNSMSEMRAFGTFLVNRNWTIPNIVMFYALGHRTNKLYSLWNVTMSTQTLNNYDIYVASKPSTSAVESLFASYTPAVTIDGNSFYNNVTIMVDGMRTVQGQLFAGVTASAKKMITASYIYVALAPVIVIFFFMVTTLSGVLVAKTISGPWQRLNKIQEQTIRKFVPQSFLRLVNCEKISDVKLGVQSRRWLAMMHVEIRGLHDTKSLETTSTLNSFLSYFSPMIRQHSGFVERYTYNGLRALFKSGDKAVIAARDIQRGIETYNRLNNVNFDVNIAIHSADVSIATIGEEGRMDCVIMSREADIPEQLNIVNEKIGTGIVTSQQVLSGKQQELCRRFIGNIIDQHDRKIEAYQVFTDDDHRNSTVTTFDRAVKFFEDEQYFTAQKLFCSVLNEDPVDSVALAYMNACEQITAQCEKKIEQTDMVVALNDERVLEVFELMCRNERSTENVELWKVLRDTKLLVDTKEHHEKVKKIYERYCDVINISEQTKSRLREQLTHSIVPENVLDDLRVEVELNMKDTWTRFKRTDVGKDAIIRVFGFQKVRLF